MTISTPAPRAVRPAGTPHRPSTVGYWIGGALLAAGVVGAAIWAVLTYSGYLNQVNSFQRMTTPGTATVHVTRATTRVLYYESPGLAPSLAYPTEVIYHAPLVSPTRTGKAVASFDATTSGNYRINATGTGGTIAIGGDILWDFAPHVVGIIAVLLVGMGAGVTVMVVTAVRRSSGRQVGAAPR
jgi:hypothetical protein